MSKKHRVRTHHWNNGILETLDHFFDSLDEASLFSGTVNAHTIKVYDPDGNLIDSKSSSAVPEQISTAETYSGVSTYA
jgi:hypothetical protein